MSFEKLESKTVIHDFLFITVGIITAGLGLKSFLLPSNFIDGGITGISLLINLLTDIDLSILIIVINIPFLLFGFRQISLQFSLKTAIAIAVLAIAVAVIPYPEVTEDPWLASAFGGFFLGAGVGLSMRGGAVLDGTEVVALAISRRTYLTVGDVILLFNIVIFSIAAILVNMETAMYAILTYFSAARTVDFIVQGIEEYTAVTVISQKSDEIKKMIIESLAGV